MTPELLVAPDASSLIEMLAARLALTARAAIEERGAFSLALSGGSTPKALYQRLASPDWKDQIDWSKCDIVFGDDRAVAPNDELSNFRMAREALLDHIGARVHRIQTEADDLDKSAADYDAVLRELGRLDIVLLGLGDDGHTASLFPGSPQLEVKNKWVTATPVASLEPHVRRVTLTFEAINAARHAWFLVTGVGKAARVKGSVARHQRCDAFARAGRELASGRNRVVFGRSGGERFGWNVIQWRTKQKSRSVLALRLFCFDLKLLSTSLQLRPRCRE